MSKMDYGMGQAWMANVLTGSTEIPVDEMMDPRNATEVFRKELFVRLTNNLSC